MLDLHAPVSIEVNRDGHVTGLWTEPKQVGLIHNRRADVIGSGRAPELIPCDVVVVAVGQSIDAQYFAEEGIPIKRGVIDAQEWDVVNGYTADVEASNSYGVKLSTFEELALRHKDDFDID